MGGPIASFHEIPRVNQPRHVTAAAERWRALTRRDATDDFVYAVLTTKIYCRPSCSARLARRANIQFYDTPSQAEEAGFRPCKRCRPQSGQTAAQNNPRAAMVEKACAALRDDIAAGLKPRLQDLAAQAGLSPSHFHRAFKNHMGVTPGQYARSLVENQQGSGTSPGFSTPVDLCDSETDHYTTMDGVEEGALGLVLNEDLALPTAGLSTGGEEAFSPVILDHGSAWNEFDVLLAAEQGARPSLESMVIDPLIISGSDDVVHERIPDNFNPDINGICSI